MKNDRLAMAIMLAMAFPAAAQTATETAIMKPIHDLFRGMKNGDSALVHGAFAGRVSFVTIGQDKMGKPFFQKESLNDFLRVIGTSHAEPFNELIWDTDVKVDGNFAQVWAKFAFYLGKKFNHCGVDAFQLFRGADGSWKIFNLADTRQKDGCNVPDRVAAQLNE